MAPWRDRIRCGAGIARSITSIGPQSFSWTRCYCTCSRLTFRSRCIAYWFHRKTISNEKTSNLGISNAFNLAELTSVGNCRLEISSLFHPRVRAMNLKTIRDYHAAHRQLDQQPFSQEVKLAFLTSYTSDFILPLLQVDLMQSRIRAELYKPHFNQFRQEMLNHTSGLYAAQPDITIVGFNIEDVFPIFESDPSDVAQEALGLCESMIRS